MVVVVAVVVVGFILAEGLIMISGGITDGVELVEVGLLDGVCVCGCESNKIVLVQRTMIGH